MIRRLSALRISAALLPDTSAAGAAAFVAAWRERFCAVCWRPRACPPLRAAALRLVEPLPLAREELLLRELDEEELVLRDFADPLVLRVDPLLLPELFRASAKFAPLPSSPALAHLI